MGRARGDGTASANHHAWGLIMRLHLLRLSLSRFWISLGPEAAFGPVDVELNGWIGDARDSHACLARLNEMKHGPNTLCERKMQDHAPANLDADQHSIKRAPAPHAAQFQSCQEGILCTKASSRHTEACSSTQSARTVIKANFAEDN